MATPNPAHVDMEVIGMVGVIVRAEGEVEIVAEAITNVVEKFGFWPRTLESCEHADEAAIGHTEA